MTQLQAFEEEEVLNRENDSAQAVEEEEVLNREHDSAIDSEECEVIDRTKQYHYAAIHTRSE
jgi:hypothetical protein